MATYRPHRSKGLERNALLKFSDGSFEAVDTKRLLNLCQSLEIGEKLQFPWFDGRTTTNYPAEIVAFGKSRADLLQRGQALTETEGSEDSDSENEYQPQHDLLAKKAGKAAPVVSAADAPSINLERAAAPPMSTSTEINDFDLHRRAASTVPVMADLAATISSGILAQNEQVNLTQRGHPATDSGDILLIGATEPPENIENAVGVEGPGGAKGIPDGDTTSMLAPAMLRELIIAMNRIAAAVEKQNEILEAKQQVEEPITHHIHTGEEDNDTAPTGPVIPESKIRSCVEKADGSRSRLYKYLLEEIIPAEERIGTTPTTCPKDASNPNIQKLSNSILDYAEGIVFSRIPWGASERDDAAAKKRRKASVRNALNTNWRKAYCKGLSVVNETENIENNVPE